MDLRVAQNVFYLHSFSIVYTVTMTTGGAFSHIFTSFLKLLIKSLISKKTCQSFCTSLSKSCLIHKHKFHRERVPEFWGGTGGSIET